MAVAVQQRYFKLKLQDKSKEVLTSVLINNNTITKANTANNNLNNESIALLISGRYNEAISLFDKVLAVDPNDANTLTNKGNALDTLGMHQEAVQVL